DSSILDVTDDTHKLYILCFIAHQKDKQMNQSIDGWATILDCDYKTAKTYLGELQEEERIYCEIGEKYIDGNGNYKQRPTKWFLGRRVEDTNTSVEEYSEVVESSVESLTMSKDKEQIIVSSTVNKTNSDNALIKWGNWNPKNGERVNLT